VNRLAPRDRRIVLAFFFLSGATGLAYQAVWFRHLHALFGVTTHAVAVVVAVFMGGLALGAWWLGRFADRDPSPLRLYGRLEIGVALLALVVGPAVAWVERAYVALHPHLATSTLWLSILRGGLAAIAILPPTILMGGTLPALVALARRQHAAHLDRDLALLYGINTLGAVSGAALTGFVLLALWGLSRTTLAAAAVNLAVGLWAWWRGNQIAAPAATEAPESRAMPADRVAFPTAGWGFAAGAAALSGALALAYEVAWTRALAQILGSSTYAFALILVAILLGIGVGSMVHGRRGGLRTFAIAQHGAALSAALVVPVLVRLPDVQLFLFRRVQDHLGVLIVQLGLCLAVILVPAWCMGAGFPALVAATVGRDDAGRGVGRIYAANTLGAIVGSLAAGFVALPRLGTQRTLVLVVAMNAMLGAVAWRRAGMPRRGWVLAAAALLLAAATPRWDPYVLDAGIAIGGPAISRGVLRVDAATLGRGSALLDYREGVTATISVRRDESQLYLKTNGKTDGTSRGDMPTQLMLGLLPSLVHPAPRRALVIGLGTGVSARAALSPPDLEHLDVVEIEPEVVRAARRWFGSVNRPLFNDPRAHVVVDDARAFLRITSTRYDVVVSEPSNPWIAGVASLFSVDHYQRCAARMEDGGILAQWVQIYALRPELLRMVLASLQSVFPFTAVYAFHHGDLIVLASRTPLPRLDPAAITQRIESWKVADEMQRYLGVRTGGGVAGACVLETSDVARFHAGATLHTDDRPRLEFEAPRSLYLATRDSNAALLRAARQGPAPAMIRPLAAGGALDAARMALRAQRPLDAQAWFASAGEVSMTLDADALTLRGEIALALGQTAAAAADWSRALGLDASAWHAQQNLGMLLTMQGRLQDGLALLDAASAAAARGAPPDFEPSARYLELLLQTERAAEARAVADAILSALPPALPDSALSGRLVGLAARAHLATGDVRSAGRLAQRALALQPQNTAAWRALGAIAFAAGRYAEAVRWWEHLLEYRQTGTDVVLPLAQAYAESGDRRRARRLLDDVLRREPEHAMALRLRARL